MKTREITWFSVCVIALAAFAFGVITIIAVEGEPKEEVKRYIDVEYNVMCYYTASSMDCIPYRDEGTHLEFK